MNIANFINIYIYIYIYIYMQIYIYIYMQIYIAILYVIRMTQNKNDSIYSILQHGGVVDNNYFVVFATSKFSVYIGPMSQIAQMEGSYHLLSHKD